MPQLTPDENELLKMLTNPQVPTIGKRRMKEVAQLIHRLLYLTDQADQGTRDVSLMANGLFLVVSGKLSESDIYANDRLSDDQRDDLLGTLQVRLFAEAYCENEGLILTGLEVSEKTADTNLPVEETAPQPQTLNILSQAPTNE